MNAKVSELHGVYPMRVVARLTGLTADTIRVWERRYKAVEPDRTGGNKRRYSHEQIRRLVLLRRATELGHSIGQVAKLEDDALRRIIGELPAPSDEGSSLYEALVDDYLEAVFSYDVREAEGLLSRTAAIVPPMQFTLEFIVPLMRRIGDAWSRHEFKIAHEHIISGQLRSLLGTLMRHAEPAAGAPRIVVATPPGHLHEFGAIIGAFISASRGLEPIYLGTHMPFDDMAEACSQSGSELLLLSIVRDLEPNERESIVAGLKKVGSQHEVWLGLPEQHELVNAGLPVRLLHRYEDLDEALRSRPWVERAAHA